MDQSKKKALKEELRICKDQITKSLKKLFQKKHITKKRSPLIYPCYFKEYKFQGYNLNCHLQPKEHQLPCETAKLHQSYFTRQINFITKVSKVNENEPVLCSKRCLFFNRIDLHQHNKHKLLRKSKELEKQKHKSRALTKHFLDEFERKRYLDNLDSECLNEKAKTSDKERSNEHAKKSEITAHNPNPQNINEKELTSGEQRQKKPQMKKIKISQDKEQGERPPIKIGPSSSSEVRLRGRYVKATQKEKEHLSLLKNKRPLTKAEKKCYGLPVTSTLKFQYECAEQLLEDYLEYMEKFQARKKKVRSPIYTRHKRRVAIS